VIEADLREEYSRRLGRSPATIKVNREDSNCDHKKSIGFAESVLPIAALTDISVLLNRVDFVVRAEKTGKSKE
jgi:hypothetical protein